MRPGASHRSTVGRVLWIAAGLLLQAGAVAAASDTLSLGSVGRAEPGREVRVPIRLRDRPSSPLDNDGPAFRAIRQLAVTVRPSSASLLESIDIVRAGATADLVPAFETRSTVDGRETWLASFAEPLPVPTGDSKIIAQVVIRLALDAPSGATLDLELVGASTVLSNAMGTVLETEDNGYLTLEDGSVSLVSSGACVPDAASLCLLDRRFRLAVSWKDFAGAEGTGRAVPLTTDSGYFWFFSETNVEIVVKTLDGTAINDHFWVFFGSLTNVEFVLEVTDTATAETRTYRNPSGSFASRGDTMAFPAKTAAADRPPLPPPRILPSPIRPLEDGCAPTDEQLCLLDGRFRLEVTWTDFSGGEGEGLAVPLTSDAGYFWFFNPENVEIVVKTLDATAINGHYWVFYGALTNVGFELTVTDTETDDVQVYRNPSGTFASVGDTSAF